MTPKQSLFWARMFLVALGIGLLVFAATVPLDAPKKKDGPCDGAEAVHIEEAGIGYSFCPNKDGLRLDEEAVQ